MNQGRTKERPKNSQTEKVRFINIAVSYTSPHSTERTTRDDREKSASAPCQKKFCFLRLRPYKVVLIPKKVDSHPKKVDSFPETIDLPVF